MTQELEKLRDKSFALGEDLDKLETAIEKALKTGKISKAKKIIDNLISETQNTKDAIFTILVKDQQDEDYHEVQQALVLFNFTTEIENRLYSIKDRKGIR
jgi:hypothetical protein